MSSPSDQNKTPPPGDDSSADLEKGELAPPCDFGQDSCLIKSGVFRRPVAAAGISQTPAESSAEPDAPDSPVTPFSVATGERKYLVEQKIDKGGMGFVYRAADRDIRRQVALKIVAGDDPHSRMRLIEEAQVTGQLEHPNIVPIHELGVSADGRLFFAMKLVVGKTLKEIIALIKADPPNAPPEYSRNSLLLAFISVCHAVAFAHSKGVIHRDLKPANVMVGEYGEVLVVDWGLARPMGRGKREQAPEARRSLPEGTHAAKLDDTVRSLREETGVDITMEGMVVGTPAYMSPEQASGDVELVDEKSDIYALGAILYEILTLERPVDGKNFNQLLANIICGFVVPPEKRVADLPRELSAVAMKALAKNKADRYATAKDLRTDVQRYLEGRSVSAKEDTAWETVVKLVKRNKLASVAAGVILLLILASLVVNIRERANTTRAFRSYRSEQKAREALIAKDYYERQRKWTLAFEDDFSDPDVHQRWDIVYGVWATVKGERVFRTITPDVNIVDGQLHIGGGFPQVLILKTPIRGDCAVEFDCRQDSAYLNDASCFVAGVRTAEIDKVAYTGYIFQFGGYDNTRVILERAQTGTLWQDYGSPIEQGKTLHVRAERIGGRLLYIVNGDTTIDVVDEDPLFGVGRDVVGLYGYRAHVAYDNVKVYNMGVPVKDDLVAVAQRQLQAGNYQTASHLFEEIVGTSVDAASRERAQVGLEKSLRLVDITDRMPQLSERIAAAWPMITPRLEVAEDGLVLDLGIVPDTVSDLSALEGIPLVRLSMAKACSLRSLQPLANMELRTLLVRESRALEDLWPIASLHLDRLDISTSKVSDLSALRGMPLTVFEASTTQIRDLTSLRGMRLERLYVHSNNLEDLSPLEGMPLAHLWANHNKLTDLRPLAGMPLRVVLLSYNRALKDISPLEDSPVSDLRLRGTSVSDISPVEGMPLINLELDDTRVDDISAAAQPRLGYLGMDNTPVSDLSPLARCKLKWLSVHNTRVTDLSALRGMPMWKLGVDGVPLTAANVQTIKSLPLGCLGVDLLDTTAQALVRRMDRLTYVNNFRRHYAISFLDMLLAGLSDSLTGLKFRDKATVVGDKRYFVVPARLTFDEATRFCNRYRAILASPRTGDEHSEFATYVESLTLLPVFELFPPMHVALRRHPKTGEYGWIVGQLPMRWYSESERDLVQTTGLGAINIGSGDALSAMTPEGRAFFAMQWDR